MSATATTGKLYFTIFPGRFDAAICIAFFTRLIGHVDLKIHLVLDRHSVHRSKAVREWVAARIIGYFQAPYTNYSLKPSSC